MTLIVRPALVLLLMCSLLTTGALLVGYQSPTAITILTTNTWEGIHMLEVWDTPRHFGLLLAGTRCYETKPTLEPQPNERFTGGYMSTEHLLHRIEDGAEAVVLLKC